MAEVKGHCEDAFSRLKDLLAKQVASDEDLGASICVNVDGKNVVDIWSGYTDEEKTKEWEQDTLVNVWSSSKTVSNLAVLIAHDRGLLDVHEKISKYWPDFATDGKQDIEVRNILSHSAGLPSWGQRITMQEVCDVKPATEILAKQAPWWEPGTASGYHALTQGFLGGEVIRQVTGKSLKAFIAEEIAGPMGADFQLGAAEKDWPRISTLIPPPPLTGEVGQVDPDSIAIRALSNPGLDARFALTPEWRNAEVGAANGHGNARSLNRIMSVVSLGGEVDGVRLLGDKTIDLIFQEQTNGMDLVLGKKIRFGIGYGLPLSETLPWIPEGRKCFWGGWVSVQTLLFGTLTQGHSTSEQ